MDKKPVNSFPTHFMDIHDEVLSEGDEEGTIKNEENEEKTLNKPTTRARETKRNHRSINRQFSLETGFSVLNRERKGKDDRKVLTRSGTSLGGANRFGLEGHKRDFSIFKTKSTLSKQNSLLPRKIEKELESQKINGASGVDDDSVNASVPAGRYFAALRGPELDEVKDYEDILLPTDEQWPFLLRFPIGCFGICLGLSSQAVLWLNLATSPATRFLHISPDISFLIWLLSLAVLIAVSITYILKCIFYFEAVRREYFHPVRINFFFAPWVVCMFLAISVPSRIVPQQTLHPAIWVTFIVPYFLLELKIYGQWLSGGKRRLSKVANPSNHLSVSGNFVGAILASKVGWKEPAKFFWAVGFAHYLVVFVTLYQRLPTSEALPKELHPVYSMFIAAPSAACIAWQSIYGEFDGISRNCYFIALFLYISLVVRIKFFTGFRFSVAWWAYTFPMTTVSVATIRYAEAVPAYITKGLALGLAFMSSTMVSVLFVSTLLHALYWRTLFPNDLAIAITKRKQGGEKKPLKKAYDIKRWTKKALTKNSENKDNSKNNGYNSQCDNNSVVA
ncbi:putative voltage-dependent anion channel [Medicago truncatula]|uniref:C4-dicarboxylate transporter/malic acid protein n=1 Tax=Medicago truncatula TaxID=3880 RepID=G7JK66_MEDTR|nr:guard cell S-type anion channel SLAC1 [Medicago truncatula]AES90978.1 C4-dicarboxylate transporter/malic acid protein [Medicago truncatula]RHN63288.1 putative voltage-dependent anion channel [Medicago truncatula]